MKTKCKHCKYEWVTESELQLVTCPNCGKKTKVNYIKDGTTRGSKCD